MALTGDHAVGDSDHTPDHNLIDAKLDELETSLSAKQALDADLTSIAALSPSNDDVLQRKAGAWTNRTVSQLKTDLANGISDISGLQAALDAKLALAAYDANTILKADSDDTPTALTVAASTVVGRKASGAIVSMTMEELKDLLGTESDRVFATGESVSTPGLANSTAVGLTSQVLKLRYFTARKSETINTIAYAVGATAAGATPTISRIGIWEASQDGALTSLVASSANDTALFTGSTSTDHSKALSAGWDKVRGTRYAIGFLCVTAATAPSLMGNSWTITEFSNRAGSRWAGQVAAQADLPATLAAGSVANTTSAPYADLLQ